MIELTKFQWTGIIVGSIISLISLIFIGQNFFLLILGLGILAAVGPFILAVVTQNKEDKEKEEMFIEFSRNLVESVNAGVPISQSIIHVKDKTYGNLSVNIRKLANQIELGIPVNQALNIFSRDVNNKTVSRAVTLIGEAEKAGGDIGVILEAVANAISESDKLKKERKAAIDALVVQGYIIFIIFLVIVLVMQFKILPLVQGISQLGEISAGGSSDLVTSPLGGGNQDLDISQMFFYLLMVQGLFTGITIGKLSEGTIKAGVKHSFILVFLAFIVSASANLFVG